MNYSISKNRRGAISTEYVIAIVVIAVGSILAFMYLAATNRSQSKTVVTKFSGETKTITKVEAVDADPLIEQKKAMDQSGSTEGEVEFDSGGAKGRRGTSASASSGSSRSGGSTAVSSGGGGGSQNPKPSSGASASASNSSAGSSDKAGASASSGSIKRGGSSSSSGGTATKAQASQSGGGAASSNIPFWWILVGLGIVFGIFFAVMYIGRGS